MMSYQASRTMTLTPFFSIVAIHGLNGDRDKTWTADNGKNWLRHFLPKDIPNARIFTFGYSAHTHSCSDVSQQSVNEYALNLLGELKDQRKGDIPNVRHAGPL